MTQSKQDQVCRSFSVHMTTVLKAYQSLNMQLCSLQHSGKALQCLTLLHTVKGHHESDNKATPINVNYI